jgi:tRNA(adenine34) deaminase
MIAAMTSTGPMTQAARDSAMMRRCIALSAEATRRGEFPFACVICDGDQIVAETINQVARDGDVSRHAELLAVSKAQQVLGGQDLSRCTLYSNVEPCAMCSFPIRETRIGRVVFAIGSPMMGGYSKWNVLRDTELSNAMPEAFGPVPEVIAGLLRREAERVWRTWNPLIWSVIKYRGCFGGARNRGEHRPAIPLALGFIRRAMMQYRTRHSI